MKIGLITDCLDESGGGAGIKRYVRELASRLVEVDRENEYVFIHHAQTDDQLYHSGEQLLVPVGRLGVNKLIRKVFKLPRALAGAGLDIVHDPTLWGTFLLRAPYKKIATIHDLVTLKIRRVRRPVQYVKWVLAARLALRNVDRIIAVSENTKRDIIGYFKIPEQKIKVIYPGVGRSFGLKKSNPRKAHQIREKYGLPARFILTVSTLEPRKNMPVLIRAYHELKRDSGLEYGLVIVGGSGWKYSEIFSTVKQLNLEDEVLFTGYVSDEELAVIYGLADLFVYPSLYEGFGSPVAEAMACGLAVITSNAGSLPEVVGDAGIMVSPYDTSGFARAMREVLSDETRRQNMIKKGLERAGLFSYERAARETIKVYEDVMSGVS